MMKMIFSMGSGHIALLLYSVSVVCKQALAPAFPHAAVSLDAVGDAAFQLALLATNPAMLAKALSPAATKVVLPAA